jgi:hypothetical protein
MFRGEISKWLLHDEQKELFEVLVALALNVVFLALIALLLWPLGKVVLAFRLAKGYGSLWIVTFLTSVLVGRLHRFFRIDLYTHADAYVISNLAASCFLQACWSAFAALHFADGLDVRIFHDSRVMLTSEVNPNAAPIYGYRLEAGTTRLSQSSSTGTATTAIPAFAPASASVRSRSKCSTPRARSYSSRSLPWRGHPIPMCKFTRMSPDALYCCCSARAKHRIAVDLVS